MINFARPPAPAPAHNHRPVRLVLAVLAAGLLCALLAAPAGAIVAEAEGVHVGLQPRVSEARIENGAFEEVSLGKGEDHYTLLTGANSFESKEANAVVHGSSVYAVYWDPKDVFNTHNEWTVGIDSFLQRLGSSSGTLATIFAPLGQYRDRTNTGAVYNTVFKGAYHDFTKYPTSGNCTDPHALTTGAEACLTDAQLRTELENFITQHGLPTGMNTIYDIITPPGVTVCLGAGSGHCSDFTATTGEVLAGARESASYDASFCSYHGDINPDNATEGDSRTILYAAIPWSAGELGSGYFDPGSRYYGEAFDCQDGGWNPEGNEENHEEEKELNKSEEEAFTKADTTEKLQKEEEKRLENPHQEEPNQVGKGELGDFSPGLFDLEANQIAEEQANVVTDPLLNAWHDSHGREVTDECRNTFANTENQGVEGSVIASLKTEAGSLSNQTYGNPEAELKQGHYYVNNVYSLSGKHCVGGAAMVPRFTSPDPVNTHEIVGFDGMESTVGLLEGEGFGPSGEPTTAYATYKWNFGDGTETTGYAPGSIPCEAPWLSPCAGSVFHSYTYGGNYKVKLTITDVAGNVDYVEHELVVSGPPAPTPEPAPSTTPPAPSTPAPSSSSPSPTSTTTKTTAAPTPAAVASIASHSLSTALKKGIVVNYSVNEQVTGHFEVLMSQALARKLKISGPRATGLPAGTPPEIVIGRTVLVTTKGGHGIVSIKLSSKLAAKLKRAHSASLMLRLVVRNGSSPSTISVISASTLAG